MGKARDGTYYILDVRRLRGRPQEVQTLVRQTAEVDGWETAIWMEQEPGSSGAAVIDHYLRLLAGFAFRGERSTGSKADRAQPLAAQAEGGTVKLLRGPWNKDFLDEAEMFPFGVHDDQIDGATLAFAKLSRSWMGAEVEQGPCVLTAGRGDLGGWLGPASDGGVW
jgi:predicted phage terminase large subunit-like protein